MAGPALASSAAPAAAGTAPAAAGPAGWHQLRSRVALNGARLSHRYQRAGSAAWHTEPLADPDDITVLGTHLFTAFQNGVGPQGQASADGNRDSTVVEYTGSGQVVGRWDLRGKCDGLTADSGRGELIATVNEDARSSIYLIRPAARRGHRIEHFRYNRSPLPHNGGTDAISVYHGQILVSASAPGTAGKPAPQPTYPAVYRVTFRPRRRVAVIAPLFFDEAAARVANVGPGHGQLIRLGLTDPDSNEIVPASGPRFAGDFMLTSQGDKEQIFMRRGAGRLGGGWQCSACPSRSTTLPGCAAGPGGCSPLTPAATPSTWSPAGSGLVPCWSR